MMIELFLHKEIGIASNKLSVSYQRKSIFTTLKSRTNFIENFMRFWSLKLKKEKEERAES